jgi:hypothetical protein
MNYDDLHMLFLGLFVLILSAADVLFCRHFKRTKLMQTYEDVHNLVEFLLGLSPGMNDGVHILKAMKMGWFRLESWNGVDNECFLSHLLFIFCTHDSLIENKEIRIAFAKIVRTVYSLYVRFKVKKVYRSAELDSISTDIASVLSDLERVFKLSVDNARDERTLESSFSFLDPVPERARGKTDQEETKQKGKSKFFKKRPHEELEEKVKKTADIPVTEEEGVEEDVEPPERVTVGDNLTAATLAGNQTRTHKIHALTMIRAHLELLGSLDVGSTRLFETLHRLIKAFTRHSNRAKLGAVEAQVIRNSVFRLDSAPKPLRSVKARLYKEQTSNLQVIPADYSESSSDEEDKPIKYIHASTGSFLLSSILVLCSSNVVIYAYTCSVSPIAASRFSSTPQRTV